MIVPIHNKLTTQKIKILRAVISRVIHAKGMENLEFEDFPIIFTLVDEWSVEPVRVHIEQNILHVADNL